MYIHIVSPKVHVSTTFTIFIYFCDISKRKNERKWFFFFFLKNLSTFGVCMQKYPMSTITQKVFSMGTTPFLEYPCFIALLYWNFDGKATFHLNCWFKTLNILKKCLKSYFFIRRPKWKIRYERMVEMESSVPCNTFWDLSPLV